MRFSLMSVLGRKKKVAKPWLVKSLAFRILLKIT